MHNGQYRRNLMETKPFPQKLFSCFLDIDSYFLIFVEIIYETILKLKIIIKKFEDYITSKHYGMKIQIMNTYIWTFPFKGNGIHAYAIFDEFVW